MRTKITFLITFFVTALSFEGLAQCNGADFEEKNGIAILEMESADNLPSGWQKEKGRSGYTGSSFIAWRGSDAFNSPGTKGVITYKVKINRTGVYRFFWRNTYGIGTVGSEHNDSWLKFPDAFDFFAQKNNNIAYPKGGKFKKSNKTLEGSSGNGWMKVFQSGNNNSFKWITATGDFQGFGVYVEFKNSGVYTIQVSARSKGHFIDRMVLVHSSESESAAKSLSRSETTCGSGGGGGDDCSNFNASLSNFSTVKESDPQFNLTGGSPSGGTYSGQGVNSAGTKFNPGSVGPGTYTITYTVSQNGCNDSASKNITVTADNNDQDDCSNFNASLSNFSNVKESDPQFNLTGGSPSGGTYSGQGVNSAGTKFNPGSVGPGTYTITYTVTQNGCTDSASKSITVTADNGGGNNGGGNGDIEVFLVNANNDNNISSISDGQSFNKNDLPSKLGIVAEGNIRSVKFTLTGPVNESRGEGVAPFSVFGDRGDNIIGKSLPTGNYKLILNATLQGGSKEEIEINFSITTSGSGGGGSDDDGGNDGGNNNDDVTFSLFNANTNSKVKNLTNGDNITSTQASRAALTASFSSNQVKSVRLVLSGAESASRVENVAPYALFGDNNGNYNGTVLNAGNYTLKATGYSSRNAKGGVIAQSTINFSVAGSGNVRLPISSSIVSPNPVVGQSISVKIPEEVSGDIYYSLVSSSGVEIANGKVSERSELENITTIKAFESENAGVYYLILQDKEGKTSIPIVKK